MNRHWICKDSQFKKITKLTIAVIILEKTLLLLPSIETPSLAEDRRILWKEKKLSLNIAKKKDNGDEVSNDDFLI